MPFNDIVYIEFYSTDFKKFKKYYSIFGWKIEQSDVNYLMFETSKGSGGGVMLSKEPKPNMNMFVYVLVDDIKKNIEKAKVVGWTVNKGKTLIPNIGYYAVLNDFDGNSISLFESLFTGK